MANITPVALSRDGSGATPYSGVAVGGDDVINNDGTVLIEVDNRSATQALTVTIDAPFPCDHGAEHDHSFVVAIGANRVWGPFPRTQFGETVPVRYVNVHGGFNFLRAFKPAAT